MFRERLRELTLAGVITLTGAAGAACSEVPTTPSPEPSATPETQLVGEGFRSRAEVADLVDCRDPKQTDLIPSLFRLENGKKANVGGFESNGKEFLIYFIPQIDGSFDAEASEYFPPEEKDGLKYVTAGDLEMGYTNFPKEGNEAILYVQAQCLNN